VHRFGHQQLLGCGAGDEGRRREGEADGCAEGRGRLQNFRLCMTSSLFAESFGSRYCRTPFRSTLSSHDTLAYMTMAKVESTSTATQTSAIS
jgi:hypothetical protein